MIIDLHFPLPAMKKFFACNSMFVYANFIAIFIFGVGVNDITAFSEVAFIQGPGNHAAKHGMGYAVDKNATIIISENSQLEKAIDHVLGVMMGVCDDDLGCSVFSERGCVRVMMGGCDDDLGPIPMKNVSRRTKTVQVPQEVLRFQQERKREAQKVRQIREREIQKLKQMRNREKQRLKQYQKNKNKRKE